MIKQLFFFVLLFSGIVFAEDINFVDSNYLDLSEIDLNSLDANYSITDFNKIYLIHSLKVTSFVVPEKPLLNHDFVFQLSLLNDENESKEVIVYCDFEQNEITVKTCDSVSLHFDAFQERTIQFEIKLDNVQPIYSQLNVIVNYDLNQKIVLFKGTEIQNPSLIDSIKEFFLSLTEKNFEVEGIKIPFVLIIVVVIIIILASRN